MSDTKYIIAWGFQSHVTPAADVWQGFYRLATYSGISIGALLTGFMGF